MPAFALATEIIGGTLALVGFGWMSLAIVLLITAYAVASKSH